MKTPEWATWGIGLTPRQILAMHGSPLPDIQSVVMDTDYVYWEMEKSLWKMLHWDNQEERILWARVFIGLLKVLKEMSIYTRLHLKKNEHLRQYQHSVESSDEGRVLDGAWVTFANMAFEIGGFSDQERSCMFVSAQDEQVVMPILSEAHRRIASLLWPVSWNDSLFPGVPPDLALLVRDGLTGVEVKRNCLELQRIFDLAA